MTETAEVEASAESTALADAPDPGMRLLPWAEISSAVAGGDDQFTSRQMLDNAGLDWNVGIRPYKRVVDGQVVDSSRAFETFRKDTGAELGVVKKRYVPIPNRQLFDFGDSLVTDGRGRWTHAGQQQGGSKLFMTMLLTEEFVVLGGNPFTVYLFLSASHDGTRSFKGIVTPINGFCTNQMRAIIASSVGEFTIPHTASADEKIIQAAVAIGQADQYSALVKAQAETLAAVRLSDDKARYTILSVIKQNRPKREEMADGIMHLLRTSPTVADYRGTGWGVLNAATEYMDHVKTQRTGNARYESITFGEGAKMRLSLARALAGMN